MEALRDAWVHKDAAAVAAALAPDAVLVSPITDRLAFRGREAIREVLAAAYAVLDDGVEAEVVAPGVLYVRGSVGGHAVAAARSPRCCVPATRSPHASSGARGVGAERRSSTPMGA